MNHNAKAAFRRAWRAVREGNGRPAEPLPFNIAFAAIQSFGSPTVGDWFYNLRNRAVRRVYGARLSSCPKRLRLRRLDALDIGEPS